MDEALVVNQEKRQRLSLAEKRRIVEQALELVGKTRIRVEGKADVNALAVVLERLLG